MSEIKEFEELLSEMIEESNEFAEAYNDNLLEFNRQINYG